ncbi:hypothetical protein [Streptomyces sp. MH60]|uniref:hypothetical protein n=1 Tax=Streptomyces sp. MH60 TaxID=1940758 RepID=UPI000CEEFE1E|nr:hypothetical protein [Streptomyces sp. MH60]PPS89572.1 hypothetical protein BZZ08_01719 [Streptomyces sp. MH60]
MTDERASRRLITVKGLANRVGRTPNHVRNLMKYKGAPDPLEIEGGTEAVYDLETALQYLHSVMAKV